MKRLAFILLFISVVAFGTTVDIHTDDYEGSAYSSMMAAQYPDTSYDIGGPDATFGMFYLGNKTGNNGVVDEETDGEYSYQAVISFRITPGDVPTGKPIIDAKLGLSVQDVTFPSGSTIRIMPIKRSRSEGTLYFPTWNRLHLLTPLQWQGVSNGNGAHWLLAHTSSVDVKSQIATVLSTKTSYNDEEYTYYEVDIDSKFVGLIPSEGQGNPVDISFLLMSGTNNSQIFVSNSWFDRVDPVYLRLTYDGNFVPTATPTDTPPGGVTPTFTPTIPTPTPTNTYTVTATPTNTGNTPTSTPTFTGTQPTPTPTVTVTHTRTSTVTNTFTPTVTQTRTNTSGSTPTPTNTFTKTPTFTNTPTETPTNTADGSNTPTVTATWTKTPSMTVTPTSTAQPTPTENLNNLAGISSSGYVIEADSGYIPRLHVDNLTAGNLSADKSDVGMSELYLEGGISVTRGGFTVGPDGSWNRSGTLKLDDDTYITVDGTLFLEGMDQPPYYSDSWNAINGTIRTKSTTNTGALYLGYDNAGFNLYGSSTTTGQLKIGSDVYIELDAMDNALELNLQNTSLRNANAEIHFGAEQGGTGFGEAFIKWNTTENQFTIGDYTYPAPGSIPSVTIDTDTNSMVIGGDLTVMGSIFGVEPVSIVNASQVTSGTFGDGSYTFQDNLTFSGTNPILNFPNSDAIRYTNATAILDIYDGAAALLSIDIDDGHINIGETQANHRFNSYTTTKVSAGRFYNNYASGSSTYGVLAYSGGSGYHGGQESVGTYSSCANNSYRNVGVSGVVIGATGQGRSVYAGNGSTSPIDQIGLLAYVYGSNASSTHYGLYSDVKNGGTNWALYTAGGNTRINNMLQLTDSGQQITVDTSANTIKFGNSVTADQFTIDTDNGNITFEGSMNPGSEFTVTGQLGYYDGTTFKGLASVGSAGEVLKSQGAGQPPVWGTATGAHDPVTLGGSYDYLTLASQVITLGQIDLSTDVTGTLDESLIDADITRDSEIDDILLVTASKAVVSSATGKLTASAVTATELGYMAGVTSAVQTQLNAKAAKTFTANRALQSNASTGDIEVSSTVDTTELGYLDGVTSAIQTQLNNKQATITGSATTIDTETLTASRALQTDGSGKVAASSTVDTTELGYLNGVTSPIQTQLNSKQATITGSASSVDTETLTSNRVLQTGAGGLIEVNASVDTTELGYLNGVTSAIQTQLDGKLSALTGSAASIDTETLTSNRAVITSSTGMIAVSSTVDTTELGYLNGVTSAIQTQLNSKQATITGSATTIDTETLTASRAMATDGSGKVAILSAVDSTELGYLDGVTSAIQTQLNAKQATITGSATTVDTETLSSNAAMQTDGTGKIAASSTVSSTELGYLDGVTSAIQTQLDSKQATITGSATTVDTETLTASRAMATDSSGKIGIVSGVDSTELGYLDGVTSAIQTQINSKQATITGGASTITSDNLTASRALVSTSGGKVAVSGTVSDTELGYLDGVTSAIQTQIDGKQATITGSATTVDTETLNASMAMVTNGAGKIAVSSVVSGTELDYLDGVTSAIQTQINGKQATITGSATTIDTETLTASRAVQTDASGKIAVSSTVSDTELGYLDGVTSSIQTQLDGKLSTLTGSVTTIDYETLDPTRVVVTDLTGKIAASASIDTGELSYLDGVTSAIQTQLDGKAATSHNQNASTITAGTFGAGNYTFPDNFVIQDYAAIGTTVTTGWGLNILTAPTDTEGYALYAMANGVNATHINVGVVGVATNSSTQNIGIGGTAYGSSGETKGVNATTYGTGTSQTHYAVDARSYGSGGTDTTNIGIRARATGGTTANWAGYFGDGDVAIENTINIGAGSALTVGSSTITVTKSRHSVTHTDPSGSFHTINGGTSGDILYLCGTSGKSIVLQDRVEGVYGNVRCGANITLDSGDDWLMLLFDGTYWQKISSSIDN